MKRTMMMVGTLALGLMLLGSVAHADGKAVYESAKCVMCHGADGKKKADIKVEGCVDAVTKGKGTMKPKPELSADDVKAVCDYMKTLK